MNKDFKFTKKDKEEIDEIVDSTGSNISDHSLTTTPISNIVPNTKEFKGVSISGLESVPATIVAVPFCRLVQPTSKNTTKSDGQDAPPGSFFFNDIQEAVSELNFVLLRAKHDYRLVSRDGQFVSSSYIGEMGKPKPVLSVLGITTDTDKLFILSLSSTSFSSFGKLIAKLKSLQVDKTWRFTYKAVSEKKENDKGKFFVINFSLGEELNEKQITNMENMARDYEVVLDRDFSEEE